MSNIIDRRDNYKNRSSASKQRFKARQEGRIRESVKKSLTDGGFTDVIDGAKKKVRVKGSIEEPAFVHSRSGPFEKVLPGNDQFSKGDEIDKPDPSGGGGGGRDPSDDDTLSEDDFEFIMDRDEFIDILFEDLELPDLVKKDISSVEDVEYVHAGYRNDGAPGDLDVARSFKKSIGRRLALNRKPIKDEIARLEASVPETDDEAAKIAAEIERLRKKLKAIPFIDPIDLKFRQRELEEKPTTQAVMFCLMDVSASMTEEHKTTAKYFYLLLYMFLKKNYKKAEVVFISHTVFAKEVDEQTFFHSKETGGTIVMSALKLTKDVIDERYDPSKWNIYVAQASDGDSFGFDAENCAGFLDQTLLNLVQYMVYIQIGTEQKVNYYYGSQQSSLMDEYEAVASEKDNFDIGVINSRSEIYPIFRKLFERKR